MTAKNYPCPACGFLTLEEPSGSYEICPVCGWEDDHVQLRFSRLRGGANKDSLVEHQQSWIRGIPLAVQEHQGFHSDSAWRPLTEEECEMPDDAPRTGMDYFKAAAEETPGYYWRRETDEL